MRDDFIHSTPNCRHPDDHLVELYLAGECTPAEVQVLERWIAANPEQRQVLRAMRAVGREAAAAVDPHVALPHVNLAAAEQRIVERVGATGVRHSCQGTGAASHADRPLHRFEDTHHRLGRRTLRGGIGKLGAQTLRRWIWLAGTAGILGVMLVMARRESQANDSGITRVYATKEGQQALITLDDSTRVTLSPRTILRLVHFGTLSRSVKLEQGEAYFTVPHAAGTPFLVQSGPVTTRVLGTEFLVRREAGATRVRIAVASGKVRVSSPGRINSDVTLAAGQIGDLTDSTSSADSVREIPRDVEWVPGGLIVFHNTPVMKILRVLSQWYGYQFRYTDSTLAQQRMTVGISTQSSAEALAAIERALVVNLTVVGDTVILTPRSTQSMRGPVRVRTYDVWTPTREVGR